MTKPEDKDEKSNEGKSDEVKRVLPRGVTHFNKPILSDPRPANVSSESLDTVPALVPVPAEFLLEQRGIPKKLRPRSLLNVMKDHPII